MRPVKTIAYGGLYALGRLLGGERSERLGRTVYRGLRLMSDNDIDDNGEGLVMDIALSLGARLGGEVFDVGANAGQWATVFLRKRDANGPQNLPRLHCFEPSAPTFSRLGANSAVAKAPAVVRVNAGLSSADSTAELGIVHEGAGSNSIHNQAVLEREVITLLTADGYVASNGIDRLSLIKIDVEGHELDVLVGASQLLHNGRVDLVQFEYTWRWIDAKRYLRDAFDQLQSHGYVLHRITASGLLRFDNWTPDLENFWETNYLAVSPSALTEPEIKSKTLRN
jgi:FkbM family methyltransferase